MKSSAVAWVTLLGTLVWFSAHAADRGAPDSAPSIEVEGTGEVIVDPDRATLSIAVESGGASSAAAAARNAALMAAVTHALLSAGAARSDLVTANYTVQPEWRYSSNAPPRRIGYEAQNTLRLSVRQLSMLGKWIDAALGAGAARVEDIEFDSSQASRARRQALAQAVANAKADAETLAEAAGGRLGALEELSTVPPEGSRPFLPAPAALALPSRLAEETQIEPSPLHISAVVTARWLFEP
ncbi:MAG TPA: SIMPL domain-containing protein [Steroidobacteraceae bacterium]|nr:SIMPL domain-containing protein [Steroidobacteraceae bacterium]